MRARPNRAISVFASVLLLAGYGGEATAAPLPQTIGECSKTRVVEVGTRLEGMPGSGSAISYENGGYQVSYEQTPAIDHSQSGDPILLCLVSVPQNCPPGDDRGRVYRATNLRTEESWVAADSSHMCGGA
jgi:hypothetical protein